MKAKYILLIFLGISLVLNSFSQDESNLHQTKKELIKLIGQNNLPSKDKINNLKTLGHYYIGDTNDSASYYFNKGLLLSKKEKDSFNTMQLYNSLASLQIYNENDLAAIKYTDSAFSYANSKNKNHFSSIAYSHQIKAEAYYYLEKNDLALENYLETNRFLLKDTQNERTKKHLAKNYSDLAAIYLETDNEKTALVCINKSLKLAKPIKAWLEVGEAFQFLSKYYYKENDYARAKIYIDSTKNMFGKVNNQRGIQIMDKYLSNIYLNEKKYQQALEIYEILIKNDKKKDATFTLVNDYLFFSDVYTKQGNILQATKYLDSAKIVANKSVNPVHPINIGRQQAEIFKSQNNNTAAINELKRLLNSSQIKKYAESEQAITKDLYELHEANNNIEATLMYYKRYTKLKDSLSDVLIENKFSVLQSEFNYNELNSKLEGQEAQINYALEEKKRLKERNYFILGGVGLLSVFFIITYFKQRNLSKIKRENLLAKQEVLAIKQKALDTEMNFKNKQITDFAIHISEKNELLEKIKKRLKGIKVINDSHKAVVQDTIHFINSDMDQNREKIQLYQKIGETTDSFRAKIDQLYTNLNEQEKKVATMLRLGQTSKQIALQLGISSASVDNYRYKLRKKMEIPKGKSLKVFIKNI